MTAKQSAQYDAYTAFLVFIDANISTAQTVPAFYRTTQLLKTLLVQAKAANTIAKQNTTGITKDKNQSKDKLYDKMSFLTDIVSAFASEKNDNVLSQRVKNFASTFGSTKQNAIGDLCRDIVDKIKPYLPQLAECAITQADLDDITDLINTFDSKVPNTRSKLKTKKVGTSERDEMFDEMEDLMDNKILKFGKAFQKDNLTFYNQIKAHSEAVETLTKPTLIKLIVKNTTDTRNILGTPPLTARIEGSDTHHTANDKGIILVKAPKGGLYNIEIPMEGSNPVKLENLKAKKGRTVSVKVDV
jgi:hypothetical protein